MQSAVWFSLPLLEGFDYSPVALGAVVVPGTLGAVVYRGHTLAVALDCTAGMPLEMEVAYTIAAALAGRAHIPAAPHRL